MIPIYKYELQDKAIAEQLEHSGSIAYTVDCKQKEVTDEVLAIVEKSNATNKNQPDLFYIESVLVSTNWNSNDDIFLPSETWAARHSPVDKPININHKETDIIGHMTNAYVTDFSGKAIADDISEDSIPEKFDIIVGGVIYTKWSSAELNQRIEKLIEGISEGREQVSMEVLFSNFDYAIKKPGEETYSVVERNDDTSYLTKHLRIYGGQGVYNNYQIGRVLKNLIFSGKGTTPNPANPRSIITKYSFNGESFADTSKIFGSNNLMSDTVTKAELDVLKKELETQKVRAEQEWAKRETELEATIAGLKSDLEQTKADLDASKQLSTEARTKVGQLEATIEAQAKKVKEKEEEVDKMKKEKSKADRISQLVDIGLERTEAEEVYNTFATASDEMFNHVVELKSQAKKVVPTEDDDAKEAEAALDNAEEEANAGLNQETENDDEKLMASTASWLDGFSALKVKDTK